MTEEENKGKRIADIAGHREIMEALQVMGGGALMSGDHAAWQILMNASIAMEKIQPGDSERVREMIERRIKAQAEHDPKQERPE